MRRVHEPTWRDTARFVRHDGTMVEFSGITLAAIGYSDAEEIRMGQD